MLSFWYNLICFLIGLASLILTILTLVNTQRLKYAVCETKERTSLKNSHKTILGQLNGFIQSLNNDQADETLYGSIDSYIVDLSSKYTFLSKVDKNNVIGNIRLLYSNKANRDPHEYVNLLIQLKNIIIKEID